MTLLLAALIASRLVDKLVEAAPFVAATILLGAMLLLLGALFVFAARRRPEAESVDLSPEEAPAAPEVHPDA